MDAILVQVLNGLDRGSAYALIALGLTLIFGTLGVVNFAHGALFMIGAFCAVTVSRLLKLSHVTLDETRKDFLGNPMQVETPYVHEWFGPEMGAAIIDWSVPLAILVAAPIMVLIGFAMERGLIMHF
jgi:branched-subunit amino acid ABC-type transport system permease component